MPCEVFIVSIIEMIDWFSPCPRTRFAVSPYSPAQLKQRNREVQVRLGKRRLGAHNFRPLPRGVGELAILGERLYLAASGRFALRDVRPLRPVPEMAESALGWRERGIRPATRGSLEESDN